MTVEADLLSTRPPQMQVEEVAALALRHWGLSGRLAPLTSERDLNFHLDTGAGGFVLKIANPAEPHEMTRFQSRALAHIARRDPGLPVPRVRATLDGAGDVVLAGGHLMRVLTWLEGVPIYRAPPSEAQTVALAQMAARLALALRGFDDPAANHVLQWDIKQAAMLRPKLSAVQDAGLRALCAGVLDRFDAHIAPVLPDLRWQVVHADLNPHNVLTAPEAPDRIAGILDFGDMVRTPLICDLAVAAAYRVAVGDAIEVLARFAGAWHGTYPLTGAERAVLFDLVAVRMVTTLVVTSWRAERYPENAAYILRNFPSARAGLERFAGLDRARAEAALLAACPMEA
jgi:Ser/Thr protein kinase RdoA (MazF antagonist)